MALTEDGHTACGETAECSHRALVWGREQRVLWGQDGHGDMGTRGPEDCLRGAERAMASLDMYTDQSPVLRIPHPRNKGTAPGEVPAGVRVTAATEEVSHSTEEGWFAPAGGWGGHTSVLNTGTRRDARTPELDRTRATHRNETARSVKETEETRRCVVAGDAVLEGAPQSVQPSGHQSD